MNLHNPKMHSAHSHSSDAPPHDRKGHFRHAYLEEMWNQRGREDVEQNDAGECTICNLALTGQRYKCASCPSCVARYGLWCNGFPPQLNDIASPHPLSAGSIRAQSHPPAPQSLASFTPDQLSALKTQIAAFKALGKGEPIPRNALLSQNQASAIKNLEKALQGPDVPSRIVGAAVKIRD